MATHKRTVAAHRRVNERVPVFLYIAGVFSALFIATFILTSTAHADRHPLAGGLGVSGTTATAYYIGEKKSDTIRLSAQCQVANSGVVWIQAQTLTQSPTTVTYTVGYDGAYGPITSCRVDLFAVAASGKVTYLEWRPMVVPA